MPRKGLLYFLFNKNKKPLYVNNAGNIQEGDANYQKQDGQPACLTVSPDGWKDTLVKYARNIDYLGIFRDMTVPLRFVKDGAKILKNQMWLFGIECICYLGILKLDRFNLPYNYESWYLSEINFSKYKEDRFSITLEALEGGLIKYFKAYENTVYDIDVENDDEKVSVYNDGINLYGKQNYLGLTEFVIDQNTLPVGDIAFPWTQVTHEGEPPYVDFFTEQIEEAIMAPDTSLPFVYVTNSPNYFCKISDVAPDPIDLNISGKVRYQITTLRTIKTFRFTFWQVPLGATPTTPGMNTVLFTQLINDTNVHDFDFNFTVTANKGDRFFFTWNRNPAAGVQPLSDYQFVEGTVMNVDFKSRYRPSLSHGLYPKRLAEKILSAMSNGQFSNVESTFLDSLGLLATADDQIVIMSGDNVRKIEDGVIKTSISDFFKSMKRWGVGLGIKNNNTLVIEKHDFFFKNSIVFTINDCSDITLTIAEDLMFNTIKVGGELVEYDDVNGKDESNQGQQWATEMTKVVKELDLKSRYRTDPYGIEFLRQTLDKKDTTDNISDNSVFMINVERLTSLNLDEVSHKLYRPAFTVLEGVADNTLFNVLLNPKQVILNNGAMIHSIADYMDATSIKLTTADKNKDLRTILNGVELDQDKDIQVGSLPQKLFKPYYLNFTAQVSQNLLDIIEADPYGKIKVLVDNQYFFGFLMDGGIKPGTNDKYQFKLLSSIENDFKKFYGKF